MSEKNPVRTCTQCGISTKHPERHFSKKGRGFWKLCDGCRKSGPDPLTKAEGLLEEMIRLLKSPVCRRCGARGADGSKLRCGGCQ